MILQTLVVTGGNLSIYPDISLTFDLDNSLQTLKMVVPENSSRSAVCELVRPSDANNHVHRIQRHHVQSQFFKSPIPTLFELQQFVFTLPRDFLISYLC